MFVCVCECVCVCVFICMYTKILLKSIPGRVIAKTQKMLLDAALLKTQHCEVGIKGKVEQSRE